MGHRDPRVSRKFLGCKSSLCRSVDRRSGGFRVPVLIVWNRQRKSPRTSSPCIPIRLQTQRRNKELRAFPRVVPAPTLSQRVPPLASLRRRFRPPELMLKLRVSGQDERVAILPLVIRSRAKNAECFVAPLSEARGAASTNCEPPSSRPRATHPAGSFKNQVKC